MLPTSSSPCIAITKIAETREFYLKHLGANVTFDCGWYINISLGDSVTLQFVAPQEGQVPCNPAGLMYNFRVNDVDQEYDVLMQSGLVPIMPLEDHPWGDRGFAVQDPNGVTLYIYSDREPSAEFKQYFKAKISRAVTPNPSLEPTR